MRHLRIILIPLAWVASWWLGSVLCELWLRGWHGWR